MFSARIDMEEPSKLKLVRWNFGTHGGEVTLVSVQYQERPTLRHKYRDDKVWSRYPNWSAKGNVNMLKKQPDLPPAVIRALRQRLEEQVDATMSRIISGLKEGA